MSIENPKGSANLALLSTVFLSVIGTPISISQISNQIEKRLTTLELKMDAISESVIDRRAKSNDKARSNLLPQ